MTAWATLRRVGTGAAFPILLLLSSPALLRGDERLSYLAFTNEKKPDGRDGQPDLRLVRPLRRGGDDAA